MLNGIQHPVVTKLDLVLKTICKVLLKFSNNSEPTSGTSAAWDQKGRKWANWVHGLDQVFTEEELALDKLWTCAHPLLGVCVTEYVVQLIVVCQPMASKNGTGSQPLHATSCMTCLGILLGVIDHAQSSHCPWQYQFSHSPLMNTCWTWIAVAWYEWMSTEVLLNHLNDAIMEGWALKGACSSL
ncbi:hypothetical protein M404DRAFT_9001 [Pisolithus tinctorius Marx 270]|uniref:Uncharacterized protein n=1 Tax=Pisolithus tinctorius Marx 270 TaxID=870435 RepID=A0A0C3PCC3_PISTI|nr:hypothetical protein M404DRAFT_9001 [Pisolithus tinctorius Marx 270]